MNETISVPKELLAFVIEECAQIHPETWDQVRPWFDKALQSQDDEVWISRSLIAVLLQIDMINLATTKVSAPHIEQLRSLYVVSE